MEASRKTKKQRKSGKHRKHRRKQSNKVKTTTLIHKESKTPAVLIQDLPEELLMKVIICLPAGDIRGARLVCSVWHRIANDDEVWRMKCIRRYQNINKETADACPTWMYLYYNKTLIENRYWAKTPSKGMKPALTLSNEFLAVTCLNFSNNWLVAGGGENDEAFDLSSLFIEKTVKLWDLNTGKLRFTMRGHTEAITDVKIRDNVVVSSGRDRLVKVWRLPVSDSESESQSESGTDDTDYCLHTLNGHSKSVMGVQFDDRKIVTAGRDKKIKLWSMRNGKCRKTIGGSRDPEGHKAPIHCLQYQGRKLVTGSSDKTIKIWDMEVGVLKQTLKGHKGSVSKLQFDNRFIVSGGEKIKIWDVNSGECVQTLKGHSGGFPAGWITSLQFDENKIMTGSFDRTVKIWDFKTGKCLSTLKPHKDRVTCLQYDDYRLVTGSKDRTIKVWNIAGNGYGALDQADLMRKHAGSAACSIQ